MLNISKPIRYTAALALFVSALALAAPMVAHATDMDQDNAPATSASSTENAKTDTNVPPHHVMMKHAASKMSPKMMVEARIKTLHDKLKITPDQEDDWAKVAQTMRDNEAQIHQLIEARHENPDNMTAVDDLQSYQQITQAHADGLQKLTADFTTLYNDMSDAQKKNADIVFGRFEGHRDATPMKKHS